MKKSSNIFCVFLLVVGISLICIGTMLLMGGWFNIKSIILYILGIFCISWSIDVLIKRVSSIYKEEENKDEA